MSQQDNINTIYNDLRHFPFVRPKSEGLSLHDAIREMMNTYLQVHDPERYQELHERALSYFSAQIAKNGKKSGHLEIEKVYHQICADEEKGIYAFQEVAEKLVSHRMMNDLRYLINEANTYPLININSKLWVKYYNIRLSQIDGRIDMAKLELEKFIKIRGLETKLLAYSLADYGEVLRSYQEHEKSIYFFEKSVQITAIDAKLVTSLVHLAAAFRRVGKIDECFFTLEKMKNYCINVDDKYGISIALDKLFSYSIDLGNFKKSFEARELLQKNVESIKTNPPYLRMLYLAGHGFKRSLSGRLNEFEKDERDALDIALALDTSNIIYILRDLAYILGMQDRYEEAFYYFDSLPYRISERVLTNTKQRFG